MACFRVNFTFTFTLYRRLDRPQGRFGRVRKILPPHGFDPRTVASRYTDCAIPATDRIVYPHISVWLLSGDIGWGRRAHLQHNIEVSKRLKQIARTFIISCLQNACPQTLAILFGRLCRWMWFFGNTCLVLSHAIYVPWFMFMWNGRCCEITSLINLITPLDRSTCCLYVSQSEHKEAHVPCLMSAEMYLDIKHLTA